MKLVSLVAALVACVAAPLAVSTQSEIVGTTGVSFQPLMSSGALKGCSLVYQTVAADLANRAGRPVTLVGNIAVVMSDRPVVSLKIGISDVLTSGKSTFETPWYAYMATGSSTTAKVQHAREQGDPGFGLFIIPLLDDAVVKVITQMIAEKKVTIGFNRREGGLDVSAPLDLTVSDIGETDGRIVRKYSDDAVRNFSTCFQSLMKTR